ncbi:MAG: ComEC/Rec2 family competence protein [Verrucomicrobiota bacterium]
MLPFLAAIAGIWLADLWKAQALTWLLLLGTLLIFRFLQPLPGTSTLFAFFFFAALQSHQLERFASPAVTKHLQKGPATLEGEGRVVDRWSTRAGETYVLDFPAAKLTNLPGTHFIRVAYAWPEEDLELGQTLSVSATLRSFSPPRNPGEFDYRAYLARKNLHFQLRLEPWSQVSLVGPSGNRALFARLAERAREWLSQVLSRGIEDHPRYVAIIRSVALGQSEEADPDDFEAFRKSGALHLFAVSGLHIGLAAAAVGFLARSFGAGRRVVIALAIPTSFLYAFITGLEPPAFRASIMISFFLLGTLRLRESHPFNLLALAGLLILGLQPQQLFQLGFQFSFLVLSSISWIAPPLSRSFRARCQPDAFIPPRLRTPLMRLSYRALHFLGDAFAVSLAAWLGSVFLTLWHFQLVSVAALLLNPFLILGAFVLIFCAILSLGFSLLGLGWLAIAPNHLSLLTAYALTATVQTASQLPGAYFQVKRGPEAPVELVCFDAAWGQALAFETALGNRLLIDSGRASDGQRFLLPWLESRLPPKTSWMILTHGDINHVGGASPLLESSPPDRLLLNPAKSLSPAWQALEASPFLREAGSARIADGDGFRIDSHLRLEVLHPSRAALPRRADDNCLVLRTEALGWRILLMSDAGFATEKTLLEKGTDLRCDLLILGRHGSAPSALTEFLEAAQPRAVIATHREFPSEEQIPDRLKTALKERGIPLFAQNETGAVRVALAPRQLTLEAFLGGRTLHLER